METVLKMAGSLGRTVTWPIRALRSAGKESRRQDLRVQRLVEDAGAWAQRRDPEMRSEVSRELGGLAGRGLAQSGAANIAQRRPYEQALVEWEDHLKSIRREAEDIGLDETAAHRWLRKRRTGEGDVVAEFPPEVLALVEGWRQRSQG